MFTFVNPAVTFLKLLLIDTNIDEHNVPDIFLPLYKFIWFFSEVCNDLNQFQLVSV